MTNETRLILASASTARAMLLRNAGLDFEIQAARIDETSIKESLRGQAAAPHDIADKLAEVKALKISARAPHAQVIGADQILECEARLLDKPANLAQARDQLLRLRGKQHRLISAVTVAQHGHIEWRHVSHATLVMRDFSDQSLAAYMEAAGDDMLTSVGAYRLEGIGVQLFEKIEGDYFTILGLPMLPLLAHLRRHKVIAA